ncbi:MAG: hypothetical protein ACI9XO_002784 [Paraglaciecola sp.]|jgi:hypothetical protein
MVANSNYFSKYDREVDILVTLIDQDTVVLDRTIRTFEDNDVRDFTIRLDNEYQLNSKHKLEFGGLRTMAEVDYKFIRDDTTTILDLQQEATYAAAYILGAVLASKKVL